MHETDELVLIPTMSSIDLRCAMEQADVARLEWIRQVHGWLSIGFTVAVITNVLAMGLQKQAIWIGLLALFPLILLLLSGLYLFALPYATKWRSG